MSDPSPEPVRWGVLGVSGHFRKRVWIPARDSQLTRFVGVASRDRDRAAAAAQSLGISRAFDRYQALLDDPDIEAVYIPLPNHLHLEWICRAADAGKHVLCEKPICLDATQTRHALDHARSRGVLVMEAFMYRFHPLWQRAVDLVRSGEIGALRAVQCFFSYANADPQDIRNQRDTGGGGIYDIGCYAVSSARLLMGTEPRRAVALMQHDPAFGIDILSSGLLDFDGRHANFTVATQSFGDQRVNVQGTAGCIHIPLPFNIYPDVPVTMTVTNGIGTRRIAAGPVDMYALQFDAFSRAVRSGGPAPTPPADALANMQVLDALFRSQRSGQWEPVQ